MVAAKIVNPEEEIMMISSDGIVIRMKCESISVIGRNTSGVKLMNIDSESDTVVASVTKVRATDLDMEDSESEETVSEEKLSNESLSEETVSEETVSEETESEEIVSDESFSDESMSDE